MHFVISEVWLKFCYQRQYFLLTSRSLFHSAFQRTLINEPSLVSKIDRWTKKNVISILQECAIIFMAQFELLFFCIISQTAELDNQSEIGEVRVLVRMGKLFPLGHFSINWMSLFVLCRILCTPHRVLRVQRAPW